MHVYVLEVPLVVVANCLNRKKIISISAIHFKVKQAIAEPVFDFIDEYEPELNHYVLMVRQVEHQDSVTHHLWGWKLWGWSL